MVLILGILTWINICAGLDGNTNVKPQLLHLCEQTSPPHQHPGDSRASRCAVVFSPSWGQQVTGATWATGSLGQLLSSPHAELYAGEERRGRGTPGTD